MTYLTFAEVCWKWREWVEKQPHNWKIRRDHLRKFHCYCNYIKKGALLSCRPSYVRACVTTFATHIYYRLQQTSLILVIRFRVDVILYYAVLCRNGYEPPVWQLTAFQPLLFIDVFSSNQTSLRHNDLRANRPSCTRIARVTIYAIVEQEPNVSTITVDDAVFVSVSETLVFWQIMTG